MAKITSWRAVDAHNGGVVAQNGAMEFLAELRRISTPVLADSHVYEEQDPDQH